MRTAAVILAAGASRRFGEPKLLAPLDRRPMIQHVVDAANASGVDDVILVVGHQARELLAAVRLGRARAVTNPDHDAGQSTSLRAGVRAAAGAEAVVIMLGDQPRVTARLVDAVLALQRATDAPAVICSREGHRSPPTLLRSDLWPSIETLTGDVGARDVLDARDDVAILEVTDQLGSLEDVDRPADLARIARIGRIVL